LETAVEWLYDRLEQKKLWPGKSLPRIANGKPRIDDILKELDGIVAQRETSDESVAAISSNLNDPGVVRPIANYGELVTEVHEDVATDSTINLWDPTSRSILGEVAEATMYAYDGDRVTFDVLPGDQTRTWTRNGLDTTYLL
jgi:hypothetical protein